MWQKSYSITVSGLEPSQIWRIWSDVPNRPVWDDDIEWAKTDGPFDNGTHIMMKPKDWPKTVVMKIIECIPDQSFTDYTKFFLSGALRHASYGADYSRFEAYDHYQDSGASVLVMAKDCWRRYRRHFASAN